MESLIGMLRKLERDKFFGALEVKFEAGRVVIIKKTETLKPSSRDKRDGTNERDSK